MVLTEGQSSLDSEPLCLGAGKLIHSFHLAAEALTVRLSPEQDYCAIGQCDGCLMLMPLPNKRNRNVRMELYSDETLPCTDLAFIPKPVDRRRLISVYASGYIRIWQFTSTGKVSLWKYWREIEIRENDTEDEVKYNQILCMAISADSRRFVTGGSDMVVRVYDIHSSNAGRPLIPSMRTDVTVARNFHTNRVTALAYHPRGARDPVFAHVFFSASWDGTVQGWDDRICGSLWQCAGTNVAGSDGLCVDALRSLLLSGSYKHDRTLSQVWEARITGDLENQSAVGALDKPLSVISQDSLAPPVQIYVTRITPDSQMLIFGGTNCNMIKIFQTASMRPLVSVTNLSTGVYSADSCLDSSDKKRCIVAFTNGCKVYLLSVDPRQPNMSEPIQ